MEAKVENKKIEKVVDVAISSRSRGTLENNVVDKPATPFIPIPKLIATLSKSLPHKKISAMNKIQKGFIEKKLTRSQMAQYLRKVVGNDDLIASTIKAYTDKLMMEKSMVSSFEKLSCRVD